MESEPRRESAKIYAFPVKGRLTAARRIAQEKQLAEVLSQAAPAEFGSGWYHDEAIAEARRDAKR
jgi:hypothetical protein